MDNEPFILEPEHILGVLRHHPEGLTNSGIVRALSMVGIVTNNSRVGRLLKFMGGDIYVSSRYGNVSTYKVSGPRMVRAPNSIIWSIEQMLQAPLPVLEEV